MNINRPVDYGLVVAPKMIEYPFSGKHLAPVGCKKGKYPEFNDSKRNRLTFNLHFETLLVYRNQILHFYEWGD